VDQLPWDSDFFGVRVGRAVVPEEPLETAVALAREQGVECLYVEVTGAEPRAIEEAVRSGAQLVDLRTTLDLAGPIELAPGNRARRASAADAPMLEELARELSAFSRFAVDQRIPKAKVEEMYDIWVRRCLDEGVVTVATAGSGFVGVRTFEDSTNVELVYVSPRAAGGGLGADLLAAALAPAAAATVVTQAWNVPALRLYESLRFRTRSLTAILHLWLDRAH
jgi:GNAT superfamily N-acetyltransferase